MAYQLGLLFSLHSFDGFQLDQLVDLSCDLTLYHGSDKNFLGCSEGPCPRPLPRPRSRADLPPLLESWRWLLDCELNVSTVGGVM